MNVEVFKTNVGDKQSARLLEFVLTKRRACSMVTFDLEDKDRIMRIIAPLKYNSEIKSILASYGFVCEELTE